MTWRPSVGELVEVVHCDHFVIARVWDIERPGTRLERFHLIKDWGLPQFSANYRLDELSPTGLRSAYCKKGDADPGS
jgi:hypothetical protein